MKKTKLLLALLLMAPIAASCGSNNATPSSSEILDDKQLGTADINSAAWAWQKNVDGSYTALLYLTYYKNAEDKTGVEKCYEIAPSKSVISKNTCTEDGLERFTATFVVDGVTLQSNKDVVTYAKGHNYSFFYEDEECHYKECECGIVDYSHPLSHNYVDDGNNTTKTCSDCRHTAFTEEYLANKIPNIKNEIAKYYVASNMKEAIEHLGVNSTAKSVIDALEEGDADKLSSLEIEKLIAASYNYRTLMDAGKFHSYKVDVPAIDSDKYVINDGYEVDDSIYRLRTFNLPQTIPSRAVYNKQDGTVDHRPDNGIQVDGQSTIYNCFEIANFPKIENIVKEIGLYLYVPVDGLQYRFLGYKSFPETVGKNAYAYMNSDTDLVKGWNLISFSDFSSFSDVSHIYIEIKDNEGSMPAGDYKLSSIIARYDDASKLGSSIAALPSYDDMKFNSYQRVKDLRDLYVGIDDKVKKLISGSDKLLTLYGKIEGRYSLPYGSTLFISTANDLNTPMAYKNIDGNSMHEIAYGSYSAFNGLFKATPVIPCENQTLGFLTYQEGEYPYGYEGTSEFMLKDVLWNDYVLLTSVHVVGNWYLHYVPVDKIDEYVVNGARTIYGSNYVRFGFKNIPVSKNSNPLYMSTLYSFDLSLI